MGFPLVTDRFLSVLQSLEKMGMTEDGILDIIEEVDKDGSGTIDYNEFCTMMRNL